MQIYKNNKSILPNKFQSPKNSKRLVGLTQLAKRPSLNDWKSHTHRLLSPNSSPVHMFFRRRARKQHCHHTNPTHRSIEKGGGEGRASCCVMLIAAARAVPHRGHRPPSLLPAVAPFLIRFLSCVVRFEISVVGSNEKMDRVAIVVSLLLGSLDLFGFFITFFPSQI